MATFFLHVLCLEQLQRVLEGSRCRVKLRSVTASALQFMKHCFRTVEHLALAPWQGMPADFGQAGLAAYHGCAGHIQLMTCARVPLLIGDI